MYDKQGYKGHFTPDFPCTSFSDNAGQKGIIENVKLAYYNTDVMDDCPYLLPVYIFEGTSEGSQFTAMVYALEEDCYTVTGGTT